MTHGWPNKASYSCEGLFFFSLAFLKNYKQCCGCYQCQLLLLKQRASFLKALTELLAVIAYIGVVDFVFFMYLKENLDFTENSCKACGSTEEANNCVEVIVTNESTSCTCPSSGTLLGSPKIKKGMSNCGYLPFLKTSVVCGQNSVGLLLKVTPFKYISVIRGVIKEYGTATADDCNSLLHLRSISTL